jgi:hypothetical protein
MKEEIWGREIGTNLNKIRIVEGKKKKETERKIALTMEKPMNYNGQRQYYYKIVWVKRKREKWKGKKGRKRKIQVGPTKVGVVIGI